MPPSVALKVASLNNKIDEIHHKMTSQEKVNLLICKIIETSVSARDNFSFNVIRILN